MALRLEVVPEKAVVVRREKSIVAAVWFGPSVLRPHIHPFLGPGDRELTRLGHPQDPVGHSHHRSIWIGHHDVSGVSFWEESPRAGRIEVIAVRTERPEGQETAAAMDCLWKSAEGKEVLRERRALLFTDLGSGELALEIDLELRPAGKEPVTLGDTPFGLLGIRVARTMRVAERLGGLVINSNEAENESGCHWQHARWCDYSGPVPGVEPAPAKDAAPPAGTIPAAVMGIACFDHPRNSSQDTMWHVRDDGWMGPCISKGQPRSIAPDAPLRARYRLEAHAGRPWEAGVADRYRRCP